MKVPVVFKEAFDVVHAAFCTPADEIAAEKARFAHTGQVTDEAYAYYTAAAALIRAGWNPVITPRRTLSPLSAFPLAAPAGGFRCGNSPTHRPLTGHKARFVGPVTIASP